MLSEPLLPPPLRQRFVAVALDRHGGVSPPPWDSCNLAFTVGDDPARVRENRQRVAAALGLDVLAAGRQVHGRQVEIVTAPPANDEAPPSCDGLVTNRPGIGLLVLQADCQAVVLADPCRTAVGICHCGWRGSVQNVIRATVEAMREAFGCRATDLWAGISPSLGPCCAEFTGYHQALPPSFQRHMVRPAFFDFWAISHEQLVEAGVPSSQIQIAGICTRCTPAFFSFRRDGRTGRCGTIIAIRPRHTQKNS